MVSPGRRAGRRSATRSAASSRPATPSASRVLSASLGVLEAEKEGRVRALLTGKKSGRTDYDDEREEKRRTSDSAFPFLEPHAHVRIAVRSRRSSAALKRGTPTSCSRKEEILLKRLDRVDRLVLLSPVGVPKKPEGASS